MEIRLMLSVLSLINLYTVAEAASHWHRSSYCGAYCDSDGVQHPPQICLPFDVCCGTADYRNCCSFNAHGHHASYDPSLVENSFCTAAAVTGQQPTRSSSVSSLLSQHLRLRHTSDTTTDVYRRCGSFCGADGNLHPSQPCDEGMMCCGTYNDRICCSMQSDWNLELSVDNVCPSWPWYLEWWYIIVPLLMITTVLVTMAMCYIRRYRERCRNRHRSASTPRRTTRDNENVGLDVQPTYQNGVFNPDSDYAFSPPSYESLPKDPPSYADFMSGGFSNTAYVPDGHEATSSRIQLTPRFPPAPQPTPPSPLPPPPPRPTSLPDDEVTTPDENARMTSDETELEPDIEATENTDDDRQSINVAASATD